MNKTINLEDVRSALMLAIVKASVNKGNAVVGDQPLARWAAYTCRVRSGSFFDRRRAADRNMLRLDVMHRGGLAELVHMTHMQHGPAEVRRTWGAGVQALRRELSQDALR